MDDKKLPTSPIRWLFNASLMVLGSVIALQLAVCYIQPIWPWIVGMIALFGVIWLVIALARWRQSRW
jgi:membrane protein YdbS with pleckstrin-like domain